MPELRRRRRGFSLIELLIVITIILIIITIAVPQYQKTQMFVRETAATKAIQTIQQMEVQYESQYHRYATSLAELGPATSGNDGPAASGLIGSDLSNGTKQGYKFTLAAATGGYTVTATPVACKSDGNKTFYSDQTMVIRESFCPEPATATSEPLK